MIHSFRYECKPLSFLCDVRATREWQISVRWDRHFSDVYTQLNQKLVRTRSTKRRSGSDCGSDSSANESTQNTTPYMKLVLLEFPLLLSYFFSVTACVLVSKRRGGTKGKRNSVIWLAYKLPDHFFRSLLDVCVCVCNVLTRCYYCCFCCERTNNSKWGK